MPHLTDSLVRRLEPPAKGNRIHYDDVAAGLGIRITAAGARSFVLNYSVRSTGKGRRYTIGSANDWTCTQARAEAKRLRREIDLGSDPLADLQAGRDAPDMRALAERFEEHLVRLRPSTAGAYRAMFRHHIMPQLGEQTKVQDITFTDCDGLHRKLSKDHPCLANRALATLSKALSLSIKWGWRETNPCRGVERNREHSRQRYLSADEMARLMKALAEFPDRDMADIFRTLLLTGARKSEVLGMRWSDLNLGEGTWSKPPTSTKQNRAHVVPLSAPARQLLSEIEQRTGERSEFVFPSRLGPSHIGNIWRAWRRVCRAAGIAEVRIHDLRHSFASELASSGASLPLVGALLGHSAPSTTARYAHLYDDAQRAAVERVGAAITAAEGNGRPSAEVTPLPRRGGRP
jgi:integrase